jgi:cytochrome c-type biogenesis protein CcmH
MTTFVLFSLLLALVTLALMTRPLWLSSSAQAAPGGDTVAQARQQLQQLDALHASGALDANQHAQARAVIERQMAAAVAQMPAGSAAPSPRSSKGFIAGLAGFVCLVAAAGYMGLGTPIALDPAAVAARAAQGGDEGAGHSVTKEQIEGMTEKLAARLKESPDDPDGWAMLGRSYAVLGQHEKAMPAFKQAMALRADDAVLIADYADAMAVVNGRNLEGEPSRLIARALQIDPNNLKALSLAGTAAFYRRDYAGALRHWEKMQQVDPSSQFVQQIQGGIEEARKLMAGAGGVPAAAAPAVVRAPSPAPTNDDATTGASVSGVVSLSSALAGKVDPQDTVFVFARAVDGPRMPLAIVRKQVKDLPLNFTLDDSMAMTPATKISSVQRVIVGARVSKRGEATPQPGDLLGQSPPVSPGARGLKIEISQVVGQ